MEDLRVVLGTVRVTGMMTEGQLLASQFVQDGIGQSSLPLRDCFSIKMPLNTCSGGNSTLLSRYPTASSWSQWRRRRC